MPDDFIHELEQSGLIIPVGRWVLGQACRQGAAWCDEGYRISVSVNVSGKQLEVAQIVDDVRDALAESGLQPELLILELTETILMQNTELVVIRLQQLKALGARLAIDDFGTGYSSLAYLSQFPIDVLKIDRAFVSAIGESNGSAALVHTLAQLGKALGLETVAEGIENETQQARLRYEHVDTGQGFLFSLPIEADAVRRLLGVLQSPPVQPKRARFNPAGFEQYRGGDAPN